MVPEVVLYALVASHGFLLGIGLWAIVVIQRMRREHAEALTMLRVLAARAGLTAALGTTGPRGATGATGATGPEGHVGP